MRDRVRSDVKARVGGSAPCLKEGRREAVLSGGGSSIGHRTSIHLDLASGFRLTLGLAVRPAAPTTSYQLSRQANSPNNR